MSGCEDILRRSFLAIASGTFDAGGTYWKLDVQSEVRTLQDWLCHPDLGERRFDSSGFATLAHDPSKKAIETKISGYDGDRRVAEFTDADAVVLYVTGHGQSDRDAHYTVLKKSNPKALSATAVQTVDLLRWLATHEGLEHVLLMIDLCQAGDIADEVTAGLRHALPRGWIVLLTTVAGADAKLGAFTGAVKDALAELRTGLDRDNTPLEPYLDSSIFIRHVKTKLEQRHQFLEALRNPYRISCCLPNPKYDPALHQRVDTEPARQDLAVLQQDMLTHWGPRALVVPAEDGTGWAFTGRDRLVNRLIDFNEGPTGALVVSGRAGSGKSAVLARLVTCSDPLFRETHRALLAHVEPLPPQGAVDIAVLATGKTPEQIAAQIAGALGAVAREPSPGSGRLDTLVDAIIDVLAERREPVTVVIDALDEASDPAGVILTVLQRLDPAGSSRLRLIVGVRSPGEGNEPHSGDGRELVDLAIQALSAQRVAADAEPYWEPGDLAAYVEQILGQASSPYSSRPQMARRVALAVEEGVGRSYLLAQLVATQLVDRPEPVDAGDAAFAQLIEGGVARILEQDLTTFLPDPADRARAGLLLSASALSFGRGIPWRDVWSVVANAIAPPGQHIGDRDIAWLLEQRAGGYLVRDVEDGVTVYRPFHDALRASLTRHRGQHGDELPDVGSLGLSIGVEQAHRRAARRLLSMIDSESEQPPPAYVRRHLADHAAAGGILDDTILTPESLPYLDETRLSPLLRLTEAPPQSMLWLLLSAWRGIRHRWSWERTDANSAALDMALTAVGGWFPSRRPVADMAWQPRWAEWSWGGTVISSEERGAAPIAFGTVEDRPVLAVAAGTQVRLWDVATGQQIGLPLEAPGDLRAVAMSTVQGVPVVAGATASGAVPLWDAATGLLRHQLDTQGDSLRAVAFGTLTERPVVAAAGGQGHIRVWDAAHGTAIGPPLGAGAQVRSVALATDPASRCRLAVGRQDGRVEQWALTGEAAFSGPTMDAGAEVNVVAWAPNDGVSVLATATASGIAQLWNADTGERLGEEFRHEEEIRDVAFSDIDGTHYYLATASFDRTIALWDARTGQQEASLPHPLEVHHVTFGDVDGRTMLATSCADGITRVWDPVQPSAARVSGRGRMHQVALARHREAVLLAACGDGGETLLWSGEDGRPLATLPRPAVPEVRSMKGASPQATAALGVLDDRPVLAVDLGGVVRLSDVAEPSSSTPVISEFRYQFTPGLGPSRALSVDGGRALFAVAHDWFQPIEVVDLLEGEVVSRPAGSVHAEELMFLSSSTHRALGVVFQDHVQLYDPVTGEAFGSSIPVEPWTSRLAMDNIDEVDVLAIWGESGIRLWDIATGTSYAPPVPATAPRNGLTFGRVNGREVLLTAHYATVRIWNPRTGRLMSELPFGTSIDALAVLSAPDGHLLVAVGGPGIAVTGLH